MSATCHLSKKSTLTTSKIFKTLQFKENASKQNTRKKFFRFSKMKRNAKIFFSNCSSIPSSTPIYAKTDTTAWSERVCYKKKPPACRGPHSHRALYGSKNA